MNWGLNQNWTVIRKLKCKTLEKCQAIKFLKHPVLTGHLNGPGRWTATPMKNLFCQEWKVIRTGQLFEPYSFNCSFTVLHDCTPGLR